MYNNIISWRLLFPIICSIRPHLSRLHSQVVGHSHMAIHKHYICDNTIMFTYHHSEVALKVVSHSQEKVMYLEDGRNSIIVQVHHNIVRSEFECRNLPMLKLNTIQTHHNIIGMHFCSVLELQYTCINPHRLNKFLNLLQDLYPVSAQKDAP